MTKRALAYFEAGFAFGRLPCHSRSAYFRAGAYLADALARFDWTEIDDAAGRP